MKKSQAIPDGLYFLHPMGGCWIAAWMSDGRCVGTALEQDADTHDAARDTWAGIRPTGTDEDVTAPVAEAIISLVCDEGTLPEFVLVTQPCSAPVCDQCREAPCVCEED